MLYLLIIAVVIVGAYLFTQNRNAAKRKAFAGALMENWGKPADNYRNIDLIADYHTYLKTDAAISNATATDIDLESLFNFTDRTCSKIGQQYLYHRLRSPETDIEKQRHLDDLAERLTQNEADRTAIQTELFSLSNKNAYYLHQLFHSPHPPMYSAMQSLYIRSAGVLLIASAVVSVITYSQVAFMVTLGLLLYNFYMHNTNKANILKYVHSLPQLFILMRVAKHINTKYKLPGDEAITQHLANVSSLYRSLRYVNFEDQVTQDPTDLIYLFWELIKMTFLIEPVMFLSSIKKVIRYRDDIAALFSYIGKIDTAISIQSFRTGLPYYSKPQFIAGHNQLNVSDLYHPLVENCVPNSLLTLDSQGVLVTGSNMSGKTTFIRAMAVNALLAQTLYTSCTRQYQAPFVQLFTSIRISDDMEEHKSYFQAEAMSVLNIMNQSNARPVKSLVIIDEIFRGTNTIERVAAAKAILSYFTANRSFVFVSTHDLELAELLGNEYAVYCFEEKVAGARLVFDYKIKPGILKNKNAIAIMANLGYPQSVIDDAYAMNEQLREKYKG